MTLCCFHHTLVHEGGFGVTATDDGLFVFTRPNGKRIPECGRNASSNGTIPRNRRDGLERRLNVAAAESLSGIDASTSRCRWLGERMDYSSAIEGMQFREAAVRPLPRQTPRQAEADGASNLDHDLAEVLRGLEVLVGLDRLVERKRPIDHGLSSFTATARMSPSKCSRAPTKIPRSVAPLNINGYGARSPSGRVITPISAISPPKPTA